MKPMKPSDTFRHRRRPLDTEEEDPRTCQLHLAGLECLGSVRGHRHVWSHSAASQLPNKR